MESFYSASKQMCGSPLGPRGNRAAVLRLLQLNKHLSGAEIARRSGISEPQVSRIVGGLMKDRLVREDGTEISARGRPGRRLELEPARVAFGADIETRKTRCVICNIHGRMITSRSFSTPLSAKKALNKIAEVFIDFRNQLGSDRIVGVGVGVCARGKVDTETGVLVLGDLPDWVNIPIRQILETRLREPVFFDSNVRAAALAEYNYGAWGVHGSHCLLYVLVDEGVEMGILLEGKVYYGPRMAAGGLGQMVITGSFGPHDRSGCLELLVSNPAICGRYSALAGTQEPPSLGDATVRVRQIARLATNGDMLAQQVIEDSGHYLGMGIATIVGAIDAEVVVIDGAITDAWHLLEPPLCAQLSSFRGLLVEPSAFGGKAAAVGAAMLPFTDVDDVCKLGSGGRTAPEVPTDGA